jgi:flagellar biosynthesis protein FlhF
MPRETFIGPEVPALLVRARTQLGADATILSLRRVSEPGHAGFELVAADPETAALEPRETPRRALEQLPLRPPALALAQSRHGAGPTLVALVGPTGAGKTTTIAKLLNHPDVFGGSVAGLLCLDTYRVGAVEQSRLYAELSGVPLEVVHETDRIPAALRRLRDCEVVLVDTPGRGPRARQDADETRTRLRALAPAEVHLTLPAGLQAGVARRVVEDYRSFGVTHLLATKLDEAPGDRTLFELAVAAGLPMRWVTDGQEVPADLHGAPATRSQLPRRPARPEPAMVRP